MARTFTGDYSTGDLSQWYQVQNITAGDGSTPGAMLWSDYRDVYGTYPLTVVTDDADTGFVGRFEVRAGDSITDRERSEVASPKSAINVTRWEAFSIKFDDAYPLAVTTGWGVVTNQWPGANGYGWGMSTNPVDGATPSGTWTLQYFNGIDKLIRLLDVPMHRGNWIDVKMQIGFYGDSTGFVRVWIDGVRQTLRYTSWASPWTTPTLAPSETFNGRAYQTGEGGVYENTDGLFYYKEGIYRGAGYGYPDAVIYHANYRTSSTEDGL